MSRKLIPCLAGAIALVTATATLLPPAQAQGQAKADPLKEMNKMFRAEYRMARADVLKKIGPVVVVAFDDLILYWNGKRTRESFTPPIYHEVKAVAHVPLTLYVMLQAHTGRALDDALKARLSTLRGHVAASEASLAGRPGWTPGILRLHRDILARTRGLIDRTLGAGRVSRLQLVAFARQMGPKVLASANVAARAQLSSLNALLHKWRKRLGPAWRRVKVVNLAPRQAAPRNAQGSFVLAWFGRHTLNRQVFLTRNIFSDAAARTLLGTIFLDRRASVAFFGTPSRLERDLLSDAGERQTRRILRRRPK